MPNPAVKSGGWAHPPLPGGLQRRPGSAMGSNVAPLHPAYQMLPLPELPLPELQHFGLPDCGIVVPAQVLAKWEWLVPSKVATLP